MSKTKSIDSRIFNTREVHGYQPLFLGEDSGLFDSINKPYPAIFDLYMKLKVMDWSHTDFPFRICNEQFKSCSKTDYDKMIKTIAFQWEADSVAAKHIYPIAAPFLSNAELQIAWSRVTENECLTGDHEVLTPSGWKRIDTVTKEDKVAQWDYRTRAIDFVHPTDIIKKHHDGVLYHFQDGYSNLSQVVTPNHRMPIVYPYWTNDGQPEFKLAKDIKLHGGNAVPTSGSIKAGGRRMSAIERLYVAVQADGSLCSDLYTGARTGYKHYKFGFVKPRKIERLFALCAMANWRITEINSNNDRCMRNFYVYVPVEEYNDQAKTFDWFSLDEIGLEWALDFLDEIKYWDGNVTKDGKTRYCNTNKSCIDKVVAVAHIANKRGHVTVIPECNTRIITGTKPVSAKQSYQVHITDRQYVVGNAVTISQIDYEGDVHCLTVPTGFFVVRHNNGVSITGNCLHSLTYSEIVRSSFDDPSTVKGEIMAIKESQNRLSHIAKLFEEAYYVSHMLALGQISKNDPKAYRAIFMFVVALYCLERGQFPSSFAVSFAYGMKGMFMPIAHAVQKIQADEFQIHQVLDRTILQIEMATPRGRDFFESAKEEIYHVIHEVLDAELESNKYVFQDGQPAAGFLYKDQVDAFAKANFSPIFETFRFEDPFKDIKNPLPAELLKWFNLNEWQISPQEQRGGNYLRCFVTRDADRVEPLSLGQRQVPSKAFVRPLETLS